MRTYSLTIVANDANGQRIKTGGSTFDATIDGPSAASARIEDNNDGTYKVFYSLTQAGDYKINVRFESNHISGSPFAVHCFEGMTTLNLLITNSHSYRHKNGWSSSLQHGNQSSNQDRQAKTTRWWWSTIKGNLPQRQEWQHVHKHQRQQRRHVHNWVCSGFRKEHARCSVGRQVITRVPFVTNIQRLVVK